MNKNIPVICIETAQFINYNYSPLALQIDGINYSKIYKWISHRALPLSRKNADKIYIYMTLRLPRDNSELELMYLTHSLSINDNYWIADETEIGKVRYEDINLFTNSFNEAMYLVALKGTSPFTISEKCISAEYTGQGTYPKCFVRENNSIFLYKNSPRHEIVNEIYAGYLASMLGLNTVTYEYKVLSGLECTKSLIETGLNNNWESAFILSEYFSLSGTTPQEYAIQMYTIDYSNIIIFDGVILNDGRHMKNWAFNIDVNSNSIIGLTKSYDYNKAFQADSKSYSSLIFDGNRRLNILSAAREAYRMFGTSLNLEYLYNIIDRLELQGINKQALKNRIIYIVGKKTNQDNCY